MPTPPYIDFDPDTPDWTTQTGTEFAQSVRDNQAALRDMVVLGSFPGWNLSVSGGTAEQPAILLRSKGTERLRASVTWGTSGGEDGNPTVILYEYSNDSGVTYSAIGTNTITWDADGNVVATTWS